MHRQTGKVKVLRGSMALCAGKIVSPPVAESQVKGGMIQGISYALYEHRKLDPVSAFPLSTDLNEYHLMGAADAPEMEVTFDETPLGPDPKQSCGLSEMATVASAAAIGNAIFNATGQQLTRLPIDALQVLTALDQSKESR